MRIPRIKDCMTIYTWIISIRCFELSMGNSGSKTNILIGRFSLSFTGSSLERKRFSFPERIFFLSFWQRTEEIPVRKLNDYLCIRTSQTHIFNKSSTFRICIERRGGWMSTLYPMCVACDLVCSICIFYRSDFLIYFVWLSRNKLLYQRPSFNRSLRPYLNRYLFGSQLHREAV